MKKRKEMKTTEEILRRKSLISWSYLLIAIGLVLVTIFPSYFSRELSFYHPDYYAELNPFGDISDDFVLPSAFILWITACIYIIHFIYGAFLYPIKYEKVLTRNYVNLKRQDDKSDLSFIRGIIATPTVCAVIMLSSYREFNDKGMGYMLVIIILTWILLNIALSYLTSTGTMFNSSSVIVDRRVIAPWEKDNANKNEKDLNDNYESIFFDYPISEDENVWKKQAATAYAKILKNEHLKNERAKSDADQLSKEIAQS